MKKAVVTIALICGNILGYAQNVSVLQDKTIGGNQGDINETTTRVDNNMYVSVTSSSNMYSERTVPLKGGQDQWILQLDSNFTILNQISIGTAGFDYQYLYSDGYALYSIGSSSSGISLDRTIPLKGTGDIWLLKLDTALNIVWQKSFGADSGASAQMMYQIPGTTDFLIAGTSASPASIDKTDSSRGFTDYWVLKIDSAGNKIWDKTLGGNSYETLYDIVTDNAGNIYLAGTSMSDISGDKTEPAFNPGNFSNDIWVVKLDANGNKLWDKTLGGIDEEFYPSICLLNNSLYMGCGSISPVSGNKTQANFVSSVYNVWLVKLQTTTGNIIWDKVYGGNGGEGIFNIETMSNNIIFSAFSASNISGNKTENTNGGTDYWIVTLDSAGNIVWQKDIGGSQNDYLVNVSTTLSGTYILSGTSSSNISGNKTENSRGGDDVWLVKLSVVTGIIEHQTVRLFTYPNPVTGILHLDFDYTPVKNRTVVALYDMQGKEVYRSAAEQYNTIDLSKWANGTYVVQVLYNNKPVMSKKIIKQ